MRLLILTALLSLSIGCTLPSDVRVMSYNVRYDNPQDLPPWETRQEAVVARIEAFEPDVIGLQEVLHNQLEDLAEALPGYEWVAAGRDDGKLGGEMVPIFYNKSRFRLLREGHYWLSKTPAKAGSVGWDAALPRLITWARLEFKSNPLVQVTVLNTHFDHKGKVAREKSAEEVRLYAEALGGKRVVVTGDFNARPGSRVHEILTEDRGNLHELRDTWYYLHGSKGGGTYNGFTSKTDGPRIDWILVNRRFDIEAAEIDHAMPNGQPPSDHFPVTAILKLLPTAGYDRL